MTELPIWAAIVVAVLVLVGAGLTLIGCIGLIRLKTFYDRVHAPTLGTSFGMIWLCIASMVYFTFLEGRPVVHEVLIMVFVTVTTPVTLMLLARAALYRDRAERNPGVPAMGGRASTRTDRSSLEDDQVAPDAPDA